MAQEYQVMNGDHGLDASLLDAYRQLARQSVKKFYAVLLQLTYHAVGTPKGATQAGDECWVLGDE